MSKSPRDGGPRRERERDQPAQAARRRGGRGARPWSGSAACSPAAGAGAEQALAAETAPPPATPATTSFAHATFADGPRVDHRANGFDPTELLRDFDYGKTRRLASGRVLREWEIVAQDKEIEVAPGVKYEAWTYNGRVPGPTLRAREGEMLRIRFVNASEHPHTMHFHGIHPALMDGMPGIGENRGGGQIEPGESLHLRVRGRALRPPPLPLPRRPARRPHRPRPLRRLHHRPQAGAPRSRRDGDGDERLRHQLRPRQRGLRGQHGRLPLRQRADPGRARRAGPDLPGQRRSSTTRSTRSTSTPTSSSTTRPGPR